MIAEPFLLNEDCSPFIDNDTAATLTAAADLRVLAPPRTIPVNDTNLPADTLMEAQQMTRVRFAFWIMAAVQVRRSTSINLSLTQSTGNTNRYISSKGSSRTHKREENIMVTFSSNIMLYFIFCMYLLYAAGQHLL